MKKPLGEITIRELVEGSSERAVVTLHLFEMVLEIRAQMPDCADHLLRKIFEHDGKGLSYEPGDEPKVEIEGLDLSSLN